MPRLHLTMLYTSLSNIITRNYVISEYYSYFPILTLYVSLNSFMNYYFLLDTYVFYVIQTLITFIPPKHCLFYLFPKIYPSKYYAYFPHMLIHSTQWHFILIISHPQKQLHTFLDLFNYSLYCYSLQNLMFLVALLQPSFLSSFLTSFPSHPSLSPLSFFSFSSLILNRILR